MSSLRLALKQSLEAAGKAPKSKKVSEYEADFLSDRQKLKLERKKQRQAAAASSKNKLKRKLKKRNKAAAAATGSHSHGEERGGGRVAAGAGGGGGEQRRRPGRPRKHFPAPTVANPSAHSSASANVSVNHGNSRDNSQVVVKKRGPGRPRKIRPMEQIPAAAAAAAVSLKDSSENHSNKVSRSSMLMDSPSEDSSSSDFDEDEDEDEEQSMSTHNRESTDDDEEDDDEEDEEEEQEKQNDENGGVHRVQVKGEGNDKNDKLLSKKNVHEDKAENKMERYKNTSYKCEMESDGSHKRKQKAARILQSRWKKRRSIAINADDEERGRSSLETNGKDTIERNDASNRKCQTSAASAALQAKRERKRLKKLKLSQLSKKRLSSSPPALAVSSADADDGNAESSNGMRCRRGVLSDGSQTSDQFSAKKKKRKRKPLAITPPTEDVLISYKQMSVEEKRYSIRVGHRVKVRFDTSDRNRPMKKKERAQYLKWYGGCIVKIYAGALRVKIAYDDGTKEVANFPDKEIVVDDIQNGRHYVSDDEGDSVMMTVKKDSDLIPCKKLRKGSDSGEVEFDGDCDISGRNVTISLKRTKQSVLTSSRDMDEVDERLTKRSEVLMSDDDRKVVGNQSLASSSIPSTNVTVESSSTPDNNFITPVGVFEKITPRSTLTSTSVSSKGTATNAESPDENDMLSSELAKPLMKTSKPSFKTSSPHEAFSCVANNKDGQEQEQNISKSPDKRDLLEKSTANFQIRPIHVAPVSGSIPFKKPSLKITIPSRHDSTSSGSEVKEKNERKPQSSNIEKINLSEKPLSVQSNTKVTHVKLSSSPRVRLTSPVPKRKKRENTPGRSRSPVGPNANDDVSSRRGRAAAKAAKERIKARQEKVIQDVPAKGRGRKGKRLKHRHDSEGGVVEEPGVWVQCDACQKWRLLPSFVNSKELPEKWYCKNNVYDNYNSCEIPEQITAAAIDTLVDAPTRQKRCSGANASSTDPTEDSETVDTSEVLKKRRRASANDAESVEKKVDKEKNKDKKSQQDEQEWVQCESCQKWRRLPADGSIKSESLPDVWYCSMNTWNKDEASCVADEENYNEKTYTTIMGIGASTNTNNTPTSKLSYRHLIFGTGRKSHRPYADRAKAEDSLFAKADENGWSLLYSDSDSFQSKKSNDSKNHKGGRLFTLLRKSRMWQELNTINIS